MVTLSMVEPLNTLKVTNNVLAIAFSLFCISDQSGFIMLTINIDGKIRAYYSLHPKNKKFIVLAKLKTLQQKLLKGFKFKQLNFYLCSIRHIHTKLARNSSVSCR
ncbi:MAG: hypothetical protein ACJAXH_002408 [Colwellia sp.]|jgi:hypothetical protein